VETFGEGKNGLNPYRDGLGIRVIARAWPNGRVEAQDTFQDPSFRLGAEDVVLCRNAIFDVLWLLAKHRWLPREVHCTLTAEWLLLAGKEGVSCALDACLDRRLGIPQREDKTAWQKIDWKSVLWTKEAQDYCRGDVVHLHKLFEVLYRELERGGLLRVYELEHMVIPVTASIIDRGFCVDTVILEEALDQAEAERARAAAELAQLFPKAKDINLGSTKQLVEFLQDLGLPIEDTKEKTLARHRNHPAVRLILTWRRWEKERQQAETLLEAV